MLGLDTDPNTSFSVSNVSCKLSCKCLNCITEGSHSSIILIGRNEKFVETCVEAAQACLCWRRGVKTMQLLTHLNVCTNNRLQAAVYKSIQPSVRMLSPCMYALSYKNTNHYVSQAVKKAKMFQPNRISSR